MKTKNMIITFLVVLLVVIVIFNVFLIGNILSDKKTNKQPAVSSGQDYNPQIIPSDFVYGINNKYLTFTPGTRFVYQGATEEGIEITEVYVTDETRKVMGIDAVVVWDRVWLNNELIEDTKDWYAQDKYGNVWYFGEDSKELINEQIVSYEGSWEAGVDGAKPGIAMEANPKIGDAYRQEYYAGEAEDMGEIAALGVQIKAAQGEFSGCLQTRDWNPLEPGNDEYKYYCPEVGGMVYEVGIENGEGVQLISFEKSSAPTKASESGNKPAEALKTDITEQEAVAIAKREVAGAVTDVAIEKKFGKAAYVVEIDADSGPETDVIIDIQTGEVLGVET